MLNETQFHRCSKCNSLNNFRSYIRARKYVWDYDKDLIGKNNPRKFYPIGWFCKNCSNFERDKEIVDPIGPKIERGDKDFTIDPKTSYAMRYVKE